MKNKLRVISAILIFSMIFPILSGAIQPAFAAETLNVFTNQIVDYNASAGTLKLRWGFESGYNPNNTVVNIKYHVPDITGAREVDVPTTQIDIANKVATITNIQNDIIYDFEVTLSDGIQNYTGKLYFLPKISVYSEQVQQQPVTVAGGGVETGAYPSLKLSWKMPVVFYDPDFDGIGTMEYVNKSGMLPMIDASLSKLEFKFHITGNIKGKSQLTDIEVKKVSNDIVDMYEASLSGSGNESISQVRWNSTKGEYYFYILGAKDEDVEVPTMEEIQNNQDDVTLEKTLPIEISEIANEFQYVLPHPEIRPGSIYVITMDTWFYANNNEYSDLVLFGLPTNPLVGTNNYTYTPVRFQLTKDSLDLIYVRVYRINSGSINMPDLSYEIQTSNAPSKLDSNWTFRTRIDDSGFPAGSTYAITDIDGINPLNTVYYRVVVKSADVSDRIQSLILPYKMQDDTSKPPVPKNVSITEVKLEQTELAALNEKTSNVTISWDKPSNWAEIMDDDANEIYFHFLLNVSPKDLNIKSILEANGMKYGEYPVKYRLVKYVSSKKVKVSDDGSKLYYTLNGLDLFKWVDGEVDSAEFDIPLSDDEIDIGNSKQYPKYLLPNKAYYLQMYTTSANNKGTENDMSDKSLTKSFTTLSPSGKEVPTPKYLELQETKIITGSNPVNASVKLRFDALDIDPKTIDAIFYDVYMSTSTEANNFHLIGTTEKEEDVVGNDVDFSVTDINNTTWVYGTVNQFTGDNIQRFGNFLAPNSTYYFMVKVRLITTENGNAVVKESSGTALLPVTTPRGEPTTPDDLAQRPLAPIDFAIAEDSEGNLMLTGESVTFEWTVQENAAAYNLIATSKKVASDTRDDDDSIDEDSVYKSFVNAFGNKDNNGDGNPLKLTLDPKSTQLPANFAYDPTTKKCRYTINTWIYPNKVYYFSLRSEVIDAKGEPRPSLWVSIPVTTSLIEKPSMLQVVNECELPFYWYDTLAGMSTENYKIMLKAPGESEYTQLLKSQFTIVKDGSVYYGRILKLKPNMQYSAKVIRITNSTSTNNKELSSITKYTRNDFYQIEVKWQGSTIDSFSAFDIAIKTEDDSDYTVLNRGVDLEQYFDTSTQSSYPYYIEKSNSNLDTNYYTYNAKINLAEVTLSDGTKEHRPLKPNTKYYIKVRAVKFDASNSTAFTASKYIGPVNTRTEFNQDDYDDDDNNTSVTAKFLDLLDKLEQDLYWDVNKKNGVTNKILVKDDKIINLLQGYGYYSCTIDISQNPDYVYNDEIYMAKDILKAMKTSNKSVIIKAKNVEYTLRPDTFDVDVMEEFKNAKAVTGANDVYLKINNTMDTSANPALPANVTVASKMYTLSAQAVTSKQTGTSINALIKDKLYNEKTGIIQKKIAVIKNPNNTNVKGNAEAINKYLDRLLEEVKSELSYYMEDTLNGIGYTPGVFANKFDISKFSSPVAVKMSYTSSSIVKPYVMYGSVGNWQKLTQNLKKENGYLSYLVSGTGKYAIFSSKDVSDTISEENVAKPYIEKLVADYDLTTVFPGVNASFNPGLSVTVKETVLLFELLSEAKNDEQTDVKAKSKIYGIDKIINTTNIYRNITRQEAAAIIVKLYCQKTGMEYNRLKASYTKSIKDDSKITERYATPVYYCLEMKIMNLDSNANFNPEGTINRAEIVMSLEKMLEA